jgi:hypothetical protein
LDLLQSLFQQVFLLVRLEEHRHQLLLLVPLLEVMVVEVLRPLLVLGLLVLLLLHLAMGQRVQEVVHPLEQFLVLVVPLVPR